MIDFTLTEQQRNIRELAHDFAQKEIRPVAWEYDRDATWPQEIIRKAWEVGLMNSQLPERYGGAGASYLDGVLIGEELAWGCAAIGTTLGINELAAAPVRLGGSEKIKSVYLEMLTEEPKLASFCLIEPDAGSDVSAVRTTAARRGDKYVINGSKVFISNSGYANWYTVYAKTDKDAGHRGISAFLRRSYREGGKVKKETLANLSHLPPEAIELIRGALRGERYLPAETAFEIERSLPAGHVRAALLMARRLELPRLLDRTAGRERDLCLAMICQQALRPGSKLATARALGQSTLGDELGVAGVSEDDLYAALDWLVERQQRIEDRLARRHLGDGELVLYEISSSYFAGRTCPLAKRGYSRDQRRGTLQIVYGLLCDRPGRPIAVEVFTGELHDDKTLPAQLDKLEARFGLGTVIVVCDRGIVTKANLELLADTDGVGWITALKAPQIRKLVKDGDLQLSLFDEHNLAEIEAAKDYPDERLIVCRNPLVAAERARKREELLQATERGLEEIKERVASGTLRGADQIGLAVGPALKRYRVKKHFQIEISDTSFSFERKTDQIEAEAALDGFYVLRTSVPAETLPTAGVVRSYKGLQEVERAFGTFKGPELQIRPIHHRLEDRVRAHVLLCMLAYYLTWHLREAWAPLLFKDEQSPTPPDPVAKASRSPAAQRKAQTKRTDSGQPCHSYRSLIAELATLTRNTIRLPDTQATFYKLAQPTPLQARALDLAANAPVTA